MTDLTEEAKAEIAEAIRILRGDGLHIHKTYARFLKSQEDTEKAPAEDEETEGKPPPVKDEPPAEVKPKRRGIGVWGNHDG